jgi:hypothetical protein
VRASPVGGRRWSAVAAAIRASRRAPSRACGLVRLPRDGTACSTSKRLPRPIPDDGSTRSTTRLLDELAADLKEERWRPLPARRVFIPKPGRPKERRPLSIPAVRDRIVQAAVKTVFEPIFGKRRTTGMREGNGRVLHRRLSESRWPRVMRWRSVRAQRSVHRGAYRPVIEPRNGSYLGVPTRSKTSEGNIVGGVFARRQRTPRGLRTQHVRDLSMLRTGRSHGHPPVVMEGRVVRGRLRP